MPAQPLIEYQASLKTTPMPLRGLYGPGKAAPATGNRRKALDYYRSLTGMTAPARANDRTRGESLCGSEGGETALNGCRSGLPELPAGNRRKSTVRRDAARVSLVKEA